MAASDEELLARGELWFRSALAALPACIVESGDSDRCTPAQWAGYIADEMVELAKERMKQWIEEREKEREE